MSEYDKISAEVQMRSIKPNVISAANGVTLAKLQLKVLMGITADVELKAVGLEHENVGEELEGRKIKFYPYVVDEFLI